MSVKHPFDNCNKKEQESGSVSITSTLAYTYTGLPETGINTGQTYTTEVVAEEGGWKGPEKSNTWLEEGKNRIKNSKNVHNDDLLEIQDSKTYCTEVYNKLCGAIKTISSGFIIEKARYWLTLAGVSGDAYVDIDFARNQIRFYKSWLTSEEVMYKAFNWYPFTEDVLKEYLITVLGAK